jgi:hypothetical protein
MRPASLIFNQGIYLPRHISRFEKNIEQTRGIGGFSLQSTRNAADAVLIEMWNLHFGLLGSLLESHIDQKTGERTVIFSYRSSEGLLETHLFFQRFFSRRQADCCVVQKGILHCFTISASFSSDIFTDHFLHLSLKKILIPIWISLWRIKNNVFSKNKILKKCFGFFKTWFDLNQV